tara:strand:- start:206006 stop:206893 length:888 start_codon:yes stop_codon:yes gene_type:complete
MEVSIDRGEFIDRSCLSVMTLGDLLRRYRDTVSTKKRSHDNEKIILNAIIGRDLASFQLDEISPAVFAAYRDERLSKVKPATINRELGILRHMFDVAFLEWDLPFPENPLARIRKPRVSNKRSRRLPVEEEMALFQSAARCRNKLMLPLIRLALLTGMRRGELLRIHVDHLDLERSLLLVPITKNGEPRTIPLLPEAAGLLRELNCERDGLLLPLTPHSVRHAWDRLVHRAGLTDLHFHDLRHEAISRFFELGLSVPEVALISGHKDFSQLSRYTHMRAENIVSKLQDLGQVLEA